MGVGIEAIHFYGGPAFIETRELFQARGLDLDRYDNLLMSKKSVGAPCEDAVTYGVNAAKPILDNMPQEEKNRIEMIITSSESGLDFGKSLSTYIHQYLDLPRSCRLFEIKQACYGGTAALQMAACFVAAQASPGAKVLVIATDISRAAVKMTYAEPSQGVGAVAMLVSDKPHILELDFGASGYYGYEVMDTCRPLPDIETGNPDLSLLSYLDCLENCFKAYAEKVEGAHFQTTFDYLAFHTPFAGMVKGAHRRMMRQLLKANPATIDADFKKRVVPSLKFCMEVGNVYSATLYLALCSLLDQAEIDGPKRIGLFSYGSGCSSEFFSGIVTEQSQALVRRMNIGAQLDNRYHLNMNEYDSLLELNQAWPFGIKEQTMDVANFAKLYEASFAGRGLLVLRQVKDYHREYAWS
ncbi:MAG TPA: hydroxymethylglutaryl-CoA synthase family protein [Bacilli bacterium]